MRLQAMVCRVTAAILLSLALPGQARAQAPQPTFAGGDVALLGCRVVEVQASGEYCALLTVEVSNAEKHAAEPLEFRIELQEKKGAAPRGENFQRTSLPRIQRYGRPTPAGGRETYMLATALIGKRPQYVVRVASASWVEGGIVPRPELLVGKPQQVQLASLSGTYPVTQIELKNPLDRELDALFLISFVQPFTMQELRGIHLGAHQSLSWALSSLAGSKTYLEPNSPPGCAMKATAFELIDWSLAAPVDPAAGADLLRDAYAAWLRWPDPPPQVNGKFRFHERRCKAGSSSEYEDFDVAGRFSLDATGKPSVVVESAAAANPAQLLRTAFANLRRANWDSVLKENELRLVAADRVEVRGPGFGFLRSDSAQLSTEKTRQSAGFDTCVQVRDGRIVSSGVSDQQPTTWETREWDNGYVLSRTRSDTTETTYDYQRLGALLMPARTTSTVSFGGTLSSTGELLLSDLEVNGAAALSRPAPQGAGAAALRAIWDAGYHLPSEPIRLGASFEVLQPGTDGTWCGVKKLKGSLEMVGVGEHLRSLQLNIEGKLSPDVEMSLAGAFRDRLLMWHGRDLNDRAGFDEFFAGCTIDAEAADGSFRIEGGSITRLLSEGGLVRGFVYPDGNTRKFSYQNFAGRNAVTKIETTCSGSTGGPSGRWTESVSVTLVEVGAHLLPSNLAFEHVFGKDWGPETLVLKGLKLR